MAAPQDFDFNTLVDVSNPLVVQARPAASVSVDRQGAAANNVPVVVPAPTGGNVETCPNFETPFHTVSTCRGVSELIQDGSCEPQVTWSKGSMCDAVCEAGYGFFNEPAPKYSCDQGGQWNPIGKAPECYEIVPVHSANLQFKITYQQQSIENLQHQFDGLVYKYNDIFCPYPEECGIGDLQIKSGADPQGNKLSEVIITIDTPVYNITDQVGFIDLVKEAVLTVNQDNAFMTLIDYDNIELVLPTPLNSQYKAEPMLCCHSCPDGHAYRLGNCVLCPPGGPCDNAV
ncbi:Sushi/SCR/CCP domain [Trinorchestia longiramus]|nr:Sushi/SCR/CCP domain [Trinorchestia longiramus]